jgi:hypothetical protein
MALAEKQTTGGVILIGVALLTVVCTAFGIYKAAGVPIDGQGLMQERFAYEVLPFGLEVKEAHEVANGDRLVRLGAPEGVATPVGMPTRIVAMFHKKAFAPKLQFPGAAQKASPEKMGMWKMDPSKVFRTELNRGQIHFDEYESLYIRDRLYKDTGKWSDSMRVNLSNSEHSVVLFADFAPEVDGTEEALALLLEGLELRAGKLE